MRSNSLILILLAIGLFYTFGSPQYAEMKSVADTAHSYQSVLNNASNIAEQRDALVKSYQAIPQAEMDRLAKALPANSNTVDIAVDLNTIASQYGIALKNVQVDTNNNSSTIVLPSFSGPYQSASISFGFVSTYDNFMKFLSDLQRNVRIMDVKQVTFKSTDNGLYEFHFSIDTYWLKN